MSDSLWSQGLQYPRLPCPSPTPRGCSNSCPLSRWYHPAISSSVVPFSSCLQSFRVFSNASVLYIRWPKYWSFSFSISPSNKYSGLISFRIDWLDLLVVQGILKSLLQHHSSKASIFCFEEVRFIYFVFCCWRFCIRSKKSWPNPRLWKFTLVFSSQVL